MSWLAAARKRVLEILASSASRLGALELGVEPRQLLGALAHAALERLIGALERLGRLHARRDVGEGRDQAAVGHAVGAHLDHQAALGKALEERLASRRVAGDALATSVDRRPASCARCSRVEAQDLVERDADAGEPMRQIEDFAELPVPADQLQVLVEHGDALAHVVERGLQDFAVVVDRRIGVVEQLERRLGRHRALAQQQRQHEPRGGRADRRGQQVLGIVQQLEVGLGLRLEADARATRQSSRRSCACAPRRDSARPWRSAPRP